ncbi:response regulator [Hufsiella ginkgonis]|uniref:Response regulator n=1 Tax=Hufsiella ginkgonis TaxID=2695274 RepID=A0A7K1XTB2_9SPHI|nr:response regulator [Hufsiella ginkgonis]MXV13756.1 response regulator [Hufsiella ginkgonis]
MKEKDRDNAKSVLVVEDDRDISEVVSFILENEGYHVQTNCDGHLFPEDWKDRPSLILLDIWILDVNGGDICDRFKHDPTLKDIPIIMMSANRDLSVIAYNCKADDFLSKPFDIQLLIDKVARLIA